MKAKFRNLVSQEKYRLYEHRCGNVIQDIIFQLRQSD